MIPEVNIISRKASVNNVRGSGGALSLSAGASGGQSHLRKILGSKEHLDWLKIDFNAAKIVTVQDYKHKKLIWMEAHIYSVKAVMSQRYDEERKKEKSQSPKILS